MVAWLAFFLLLLFSLSWMTGVTFQFSECTSWPNFNMLARALAKGQLHLDETGVEDFSMVNGRAYLYSGPVPAILRLPVVLFHPEGIPTGFMIALFVAGTCIVFVLTLSLLVREDPHPSDRLIQTAFAGFIISNGTSLFMTAIPSFHHEAITAGMFFLSSSLYLFFKVRASSYRPNLTTALLMGTCLALCLGSRLSYAPSAAFLGLVTLWGMWKARPEGQQAQILPAAGIIVGITALGVGLLLAYNYARYGTLLDSGMQYQASNVFGEYFRAGNYFRYDHIPHNIWSFFFRVPRLNPDFPFIALPAYTMKVESLQFLPYLLLYRNELSASVFLLMPVLLSAFYPIAARLAGRDEPFMRSYGIVTVVFVLQVVPVAATVASTARYYYDFLPVLALAAYLGAIQMTRRRRFLGYLVSALVIASVVVSLTIPVHGILFYRDLIGFESPLRTLLLPNF